MNGRPEACESSNRSTPAYRHRTPSIHRAPDARELLRLSDHDIRASTSPLLASFKLDKDECLLSYHIS
jgi:hypothetical protein